MKSNFTIAIFIVLIYAAMWIAAPHSSIVSASPNAQATATDEPTKRPYTFPTPVFIPTYSDDTPVPRTTAAPLQPSTDTYTVQSGDSFWGIAQKVYGDGSKYKSILEANGLTDQSKLRVGTVLKIPAIPGVAAPATPTIVSNPVAIETQSIVTPLPTPITAATNVSPATITATPTPTPQPPSIINRDLLSLGVNILSAMLFILGIASGGLAYWRYQRTKRLEQLSGKKQPIRVRQ